MLAASVRAKAAQVPTAEQIRELAGYALSDTADAEKRSRVRALFAEAIETSGRVNVLLAELAALLDDDPGGP